MDVAVTFAFGLAGITAFTLLSLAIVRDLRRINAAERYYESQRRIAARVEAMPPTYDSEEFFAQVDAFRSEVSR